MSEKLINSVTLQLSRECFPPLSPCIILLSLPDPPCFFFVHSSPMQKPINQTHFATSSGQGGDGLVRARRNNAIHPGQLVVVDFRKAQRGYQHIRQFHLQPQVGRHHVFEEKVDKGSGQISADSTKRSM